MGVVRSLCSCLARIALVVGFVSPLLACDEDGFLPADEWRARQDDYLAFATAVPISPGSPLNVLNHLERARRDDAFGVPDGAVTQADWQGIFDKLFRLRDTSDFDLHYLLNLLYAYEGHPVAEPAAWQAAKQAVLDFKYWYTDPTPTRVWQGAPVVDAMWYWTENHVLLFRVNEYLAGQRYPEDVFSVTGQTGAWHRDRARGEILDWLEERARWGFTEWHSDVYYQKDVTPLLSLVEWAQDEEIARRAAMVLDLVLLDVALHLHEGNMGSTHGRSYAKDKASASTQDTFNGSQLLYGYVGNDRVLDYTSRGAPDASLLARAKKYRLPKVLQRIARHDGTMIDRERMNLYLEERPDPDPDVPPPPAPHGLDFTSEENLPLWWSMGAQPLWMMVPLTLEVGERENLWVSQFDQFKPLRDLVWVDGDFARTVRNARVWLNLLWPVINLSLLNEVNTYTYRTADYMLSTAQDYRKGRRSAQTHISQATFGPQAIVFTQHPGTIPLRPGEPVPPAFDWQSEEPGPGYWTGNGAEPRSAQHENVVIQIYAPQYDPLPAFGFPYRDETHAYFPHAHFETVEQQGAWTFGKQGDGYVALYSLRPTEWRTGQPDLFDDQGLPFDLVAPGGASNVWILECGSAARWGSFAAFRDAILASSVTTVPQPDAEGDGLADGWAVTYESPSQGRMEFDWHGPLVVAGVEQPLHDYPRYDNPFVQTAFDEQVYSVSDGRYSLHLDFATLARWTRRLEPSGGE